jgi:hypothetical protein
MRGWAPRTPADLRRRRRPRPRRCSLHPARGGRRVRVGQEGAEGLGAHAAVAPRGAAAPSGGGDARERAAHRRRACQGGGQACNGCVHGCGARRGGASKGQSARQGPPCSPAAAGRRLAVCARGRPPRGARRRVPGGGRRLPGRPAALPPGTSIFLSLPRLSGILNAEVIRSADLISYTAEEGVRYFGEVRRRRRRPLQPCRCERRAPGQRPGASCPLHGCEPAREAWQEGPG